MKKLLFAIVGLMFVLMVIYVLIASKKKGSLAFPFSDNKNNAPKEELIEKLENPLNGVLVPVTEAESWINNRPLAVMINNHPDARPQFGLSSADFVYEIVAEAGITRFNAFFLSQTPEKIGPVRSTREYFLIPVKELGDAMLMHIGYSPQALQAIETWPVRSLSRGGAQFWRDNPRNVATEHTAYVDGKYLREFGNELGWSGKRDIKSWMYKDDSKIDPALREYDAVDIDIAFWYPHDQYAVHYTYNPDKNNYFRFMDSDENNVPLPHVDGETGKQLEVKNVIVQFMTESSIADDEKGRLTYEFNGSGDALVFIDGNQPIKAIWSKASRDERTMYFDESGNEVKFNRGNIWVSIVSDAKRENVVYE